MKDISSTVHIGELIAISGIFKLNPYRMITLLENGEMEVFTSKDEFLGKYGQKDSYEELEDWCELNNGKIFTKQKM